MNTERDHRKAKGQRPKPPKWPQLLLALNLVLIAGLLFWLMDDSSFKSKEELQKTFDQQALDIKKEKDKYPAPVDYTGKLSGVVEVVIDATDSNEWAHFNFAKGTSFKSGKIAGYTADWDIALRRAKILTNGGDTSNSGDAEVAVLLTNDFGSVDSAPVGGYIADAKVSSGKEIKSRPELEKWYEYDFWIHHLKPKEIVYVMKTADGHYAKFQIISYYCGEIAGCYKIRYKYQGAGGLSFVE
ncbi:hypothetical protein MNBD_NITROSPINAE04-1928 [hydrothermal vent metagenome]|uniref:Uncharacterized protein n=1 Tax=hydrothermal vent metagenome TaxID=652676 RepID=A0A3B1CLG8_9ZZZZ